MQLYDCKVRLGGNLVNEVPKARITAAEVLILQTIHGEAGVVGVQPRKMDKRAHDAERERLIQRYGAKIVTALFGPSFQKLPTKLNIAGKATASKQPAEPTEPSEPVEPAEPTEPVEPTEPAEA